MSSSKSFFGMPEGSNEIYNFNKTHPNRAVVRDYCDELLAHHSQYCGDPHFCSEAVEQPLQRWWEMYLSWVMAKENKLTPITAPSMGPDICINLESDVRLWIEAISVTPGTGANEVTRPPSGQAGTLPIDKIILRYTSAFSEKVTKIQTYKEAGIISDKDMVIIAINSGEMRDSDLADADPPLAVRALFGVGDLTFRVPLKFTEKTVERVGDLETFYPEQHYVKKHNQSEVPTNLMLDQKFSFISGIFTSTRHFVDMPRNGSDIKIFLNGNALNKIDKNLFKFGKMFL